MPYPPKGPDKRPRPKDRKSPVPAPPEPEPGKLTSLQVISLLVLHQRHRRNPSDGWTIEKLAEAFNVDVKKLEELLRHVAVPIVYDLDGEVHADWEVPLQEAHRPSMVLGEYLIELQRTRILYDQMQRQKEEGKQADPGQVTPGKGRSAQLFLDPFLKKMSG